MICRLTLDLGTVRARLLVRHAHAAAVRNWRVHRSGELAAAYTQTEVADHLVEVGEAAPVDVAARVLTPVGWPGPSRSP